MKYHSHREKINKRKKYCRVFDWTIWRIRKWSKKKVDDQYSSNEDEKLKDIFTFELGDANDAFEVVIEK